MVFMGLMMANSPNHSPLKPAIDFTGGTFLDIAFKQNLTQEDAGDIRESLTLAGYPGAVVQLHKPPATATVTNGETAQEKPVLTPPSETNANKTTAESASASSEADATPTTDNSLKSAVSIRMQPLDSDNYQSLMTLLTEKYGEATLLQKNAIGPSLAQELLTNGLMALVFAYVLIVGYLTVRFQFDYAVCAIVALLHDTLFVLGVFAALGYLFQVEVDSLFVTAILTVVGFSVHDTIVVFDRIRENARLFYSKKLPFSELVNISVNQTLARSINTSLTALLPMGTLYFFGGETTKTFILAIILGVVVGTYSSICVASMALAWWRSRNEVASPQKSANTKPAAA
jgi:preprotein translocase subunit SecF